MQKPLFNTAALAAVILLSGCAGPPEPVIQEAPQTVVDPFGGMTGRVMDSGGIAAIGVGKSKSLELARNRAVVNGRLNLQKMLDTKMERLQRECTEESGMDATASDAFRTAARALKQQIQVSAAREMKEETIDGTVTAYALMQISPRIIMTQLEQNEDLYTRFLATKPFESLNEDIKKYEAYKQALQPLPVEQ